MADLIHAKLTYDRNMSANFSKGLKSLLGRAVAKIARDAEGQMKTMCPVDTGFLKSSILAVQTGPGQWQITVGASYGIYIEMGTVKMAARPFFYPALAIVQPAFIEVVRQSIEKAAKETAAKGAVK